MCAASLTGSGVRTGSVKSHMGGIDTSPFRFDAWRLK